MRIYAIAIYSYDNAQDCSSFQKLDSAPLAKSGFFSTNPLESIEKHSLPKFAKETVDINHYPADDENHYIKKLSSHKILIAISSREKITAIELHRLFINIEHIHIRPESVKTTLNDIIENPQLYTRPDLLISQTQKAIKEVNGIMKKNIDKTLENLIKIEELEKKSDDLKEGSVKLYKVTHKYNRRCC